MSLHLLIHSCLGELLIWTMYVMNHSFIPLTWMESFPSTSMEFDSNLEGWCIYFFSHHNMLYLDCSPIILALYAISSSAQPLSCFFSHIGWKHCLLQKKEREGYFCCFSVCLPLVLTLQTEEQKHGVSLLFHDVFYHLSYQANHPTLQNTWQKVKPSLWAACHNHLLELWFWGFVCCCSLQFFLQNNLFPFAILPAIHISYQEYLYFAHL